MIGNIIIHMLLEATGGAIMYYALSFCKHRRHQLMIWLPLAFLSSWVTVHIVG